MEIHLIYTFIPSGGGSSFGQTFFAQSGKKEPSYNIHSCQNQFIGRELTAPTPSTNSNCRVTLSFKKSDMIKSDRR